MRVRKTYTKTVQLTDQVLLDVQMVVVRLKNKSGRCFYVASVSEIQAKFFAVEHGCARHTGNLKTIEGRTDWPPINVEGFVSVEHGPGIKNAIVTGFVGGRPLRFPFAK